LPSESVTVIGSDRDAAGNTVVCLTVTTHMCCRLMHCLQSVEKIPFIFCEMLLGQLGYIMYIYTSVLLLYSVV